MNVRRQPVLGADNPFLRKLSYRSRLSAAELAALAALPSDEERVRSRGYIVRQGEAMKRSCLLVDGFAARYKLTADGERQIVSFHVPGDFIDLHTVMLKVADHSIGTLGDARIDWVPHTALLDVATAHDAVGLAFWKDTLVDASIGREWLLNIGQRDAYARLAHLICEIATRLAAVGLYREGRFQLMVTQTELADATGLTPVHINRTLQKLRADGLISNRGTEFHIEDWRALVEAGGFDVSYLYLPEPAP